MFLKGKGKEHRQGSSGKGFGRRKSPKDKQGNTMRCRICNSEEHFVAKCPQAKGTGKGSTVPSLFSGWTETNDLVLAGSRRTAEPARRPAVSTTSSPPWTIGQTYDPPRTIFMVNNLLTGPPNILTGPKSDAREVPMQVDDPWSAWLQY